MAEPAGASASKNRMLSVLESAKLHIAMIIFQFGYSGNHVIVRVALNMGVSKLVFPIYRNIIALALIAPFAYFTEKKDRPTLTTSVLIQFFLLSLVGVASNQGFYLLGLDNTSPTFASATENAVPALTFFLSTILGMEQVLMNRRDGIAKVLGTLASFVGASVITLYNGPTIYRPNKPSDQSKLMFSLGDANAKNWTLGCIGCFGHCLCWSSWILLQAIVLRKYPARFSVYSFSIFFGILQFLSIAGFIERDSSAWQVRSAGELFSIFYAGLVVSGIGFAIQIWVIQRGGPVFVSGYLPVQTMLVALMASIALGEEFHLGGIIGAVLIIAGVYLVVWGKGEESKLAAAMNVISSLSDNSQANGPGKSSLAQPLLLNSGK